jgi:hypothetical protein
MARTPLMILQALADDKLSMATARELHEAVELLRDQVDTLLEDLDTYIDAEERTERAEAKEVLTDTAGGTVAELTMFGIPTTQPKNVAESLGVSRQTVHTWVSRATGGWRPCSVGPAAGLPRDRRQRE